MDREQEAAPLTTESFVKAADKLPVVPLPRLRWRYGETEV